MASTFNFDQFGGSRARSFTSLRPARFVSVVFVALIAAQALAFLVFGTGRPGRGVAESIMLLAGLLALTCVVMAFRRARGIPALFWFLFAVVLLVWLVPAALQSFGTLVDQTIVSESTRSRLYALYGAPVLMMLFLPETYRHARANSEIILDLLQAAIVVGLIYSIFFFLPAQPFLPSTGLLRDISLVAVRSSLLLVAALLRLQFARLPGTRSLMLRLTLFLAACTVATFISGWIGPHYHLAAAAWFDLAWALPPAAAGTIALTWLPSPEAPSATEPANFLSFLGANLVLVTMLSSIAFLMERSKDPDAALLTNAAIAASLFAFTLRLALTQFYQQQETARREAAQSELTASHQRVGRLLDNARRQTAEITQISELGSLLQACASREEIFRLIPERLRRLFPGASGSIALLSASRIRVDSVAVWGAGCPTHQIFSPDDCWALRRGCAHAHPAGRADLRCEHLLGEGPSVCIPLVANAETIGILTIQDDDLLSPVGDPDAESDAFTRRRQLAATIAEYVAVAVANLNLRESLRVQAVRDPLTHLYNRRYMQEFLDRELHSARRKHRPLAVMMLDLDRFKRFNENFGHFAGDQALAAVGETLLRCLRAEDVACRYGGEQFALILPECSLYNATVRAEEIRKRLSEFGAQTDPPSKPVLTVSIGVAAFDETTDHVDLLLKFAEDALRQAKRQGRDRVVPARPAALLLEPEVAEPNQLITAPTKT